MRSLLHLGFFCHSKLFLQVAIGNLFSHIHILVFTCFGLFMFSLRPSGRRGRWVVGVVVQIFRNLPLDAGSSVCADTMTTLRVFREAGSTGSVAFNHLHEPRHPCSRPALPCLALKLIISRG